MHEVRKLLVITAHAHLAFAHAECFYNRFEPREGFGGAFFKQNLVGGSRTTSHPCR